MELFDVMKWPRSIAEFGKLVDSLLQVIEHNDVRDSLDPFQFPKGRIVSIACCEGKISMAESIKIQAHALNVMRVQKLWD